MKHELHSLQYECDGCKSSTVITAKNSWETPSHWIVVHIEPHWEWHGGTFHYCVSCIEEAKSKHKKEEDNHYGRILRAFANEKKKKI